MKKIKLSFAGYPTYRWMLGNRYISAKIAWILIDVLHIAEVKHE